MKSYQGVVLRIDLTNQTSHREELNREWARQFWGGKGLGYRYLFEELAPGTDPLGPDNKLILATGPFTGTPVPCSGKLTIITRSPATGTVLDCSVGGSVAGEIKYAGYDLVILEGRAPAPVVVRIEDDKVSFEPAGDLWGLGTHEVEHRLTDRWGADSRILSIGPAGENLVPFACITSELYRQAGRGGVGAVMGAKNLKAVIVRGTGAVKVADAQRLMELALKALRGDVLTDTNLWAYTDGTPMIVELSQNAGILPTRNFQDGTFVDFAKLSSPAVQAVRLAKKACLSCGLGCGNYIRTGRAAVEGPEYETLAVAGANCGIGDLEAVAAFNAACDDLGLDTISTGGVVAFAMELTEKGPHDFGITFGDVERYLEMPGLIARREGIGAELAAGVKKMAERFGGADFAMQIKGLEFPGYEPRGSWAMALAYATAPRGACHMSAWPVAEEAYGSRDPFTIEGKAELVRDLQHYNAFKFSLSLCDFWAVSWETMAELLSAAVGENLTPEELQLAGERIFNLARLFNVREGFSARDDNVPLRLVKDALTSGATAGKVIPPDQYAAMLKEYYELRGWTADGKPTAAKLQELGLKELGLKAGL